MEGKGRVLSFSVVLEGVACSTREKEINYLWAEWKCKLEPASQIKIDQDGISCKKGGREESKWDHSWLETWLLVPFLEHTHTEQVTC